MKYIKVVLTAVSLILVLFTVEAQTTPPGKGTPNDPYRISTVAHLRWMRTKINDPISCSIKGYGKKAYKLMANIDLAADPAWIAIGKLTEKEPGIFSGIFDGNGKIIRNLKTGSSASKTEIEDCYGFFGCTTGAIIKNLSVEWKGMYVRRSGNQDFSAGGIVGMASKSTLIINCHSTGLIIPYSSSELGNASVGGIVGYLSSSAAIINCYSSLKIRSNTRGKINVGGIAGSIQHGSILLNCYSSNNFDITALEGIYSGGISGINWRSKIINCIALNPVINAVDKSTSMSYALSRITNNDPNSGMVSNCYSSKSMIIKLTTPQQKQTIFKTHETTNNGDDLTVKPETILNDWIEHHPEYNDIPLKKWDTGKGVNETLPVLLFK